jgi:hypothetical protein
MIGVRSYLEAAIAATSKAQDKRETAERNLAAYNAARPDGSDADALYEWRRSQRDLLDRRDAALEALAFAERGAATARDRAEQEGREREHAAAAKLAPETSKLTLDILASVDRLAAKLEKLKRLQSEVARANSVRGDLPFIVDGERKLREQPGIGRPAITQTVKAYVDRQGRRVSNQYSDGEGRNRFRDDVTLVEVEDVIVPALPAVPTMPTPLVEAIKLVDVAGNQVWPPQKAAHREMGM